MPLSKQAKQAQTTNPHLRPVVKVETIPNTTDPLAYQVVCHTADCRYTYGPALKSDANSNASWHRAGHRLRAEQTVPAHFYGGPLHNTVRQVLEDAQEVTFPSIDLPPCGANQHSEARTQVHCYKRWDRNGHTFWIHDAGTDTPAKSLEVRLQVYPEETLDRAITAAADEAVKELLDQVANEGRTVIPESLHLEVNVIFDRAPLRTDHTYVTGRALAVTYINPEVNA